MPSERLRTGNGLSLAYEDCGTGTPTLLFVHGWTCDRSFFAPQADYFSHRHRVVSVDLRGHGESDKPVGPYSIAADAVDLVDLIDQMALGRVVAVGHSSGGLTVLQLAAACPELVAAVILVEPTPLVLGPDLREELSRLATSIEAGDQETRRQFIESLFLPTSDSALVTRVLSVMLATPAHVAASVLRGVLAFDGPTAAEQCRVPVLHIGAMAPPDGSDGLSRWNPNVVHHCTGGAGHFNQIEVPDQVNAMIEAFVRHRV